MDRKIYIYFDDTHTIEPVLMGLLTARQVRGHEVFSFEFAEDWLRNSRCHLFDPDLQFFFGSAVSSRTEKQLWPVPRLIS